GEDVRLAAIREAREESGLEIQINRLLNVYSYPGRAPVVVVFTASIVGGCLGCDDESLEARYFDSADIPWADLAFRSTREALQESLVKVDRWPVQACHGHGAPPAQLFLRHCQPHSGKAQHELSDCNAPLDACELSAEAVVRAEAEAEMPVRIPLDVEP